MALVSSVLVAAIYCGSPFVGGNHKSQYVLVATVRCHLKVRQASVEGEVFLSSSILALDLVGHSPLEELGKGAVVILQVLQPLRGKSDYRLTLLGPDPVAICQVTHGEVTIF